MHARLVPPAPRLLGRERHDRREQPLERVERGAQRRTGRRRGRVAPRAVGAALDELDVVVAEPPEERLGCARGRGRSRTLRTRSVASAMTASSLASIDWSTTSIGPPSAVDFAETEHELGDVEQLVGELAADLHLVLAERGVDARPRRPRPVAHGVGAVLVEQRHRRDDVALRLRHLLAIGIEDPARQRGVTPWRAPELVMAAHDRGEQPGADDVVRLGSEVHREHARRTVPDLPATCRRSAVSVTTSPTCRTRRGHR